MYPIQTVGARLAGEGGLTADQAPADVPDPNCRSWLASEGGLTADLTPADVPDPNCGSWLARTKKGTDLYSEKGDRFIFEQSPFSA
jgi:hypothetical protein